MPKRLAFVDIETTGFSARLNKIIEIAIILMENNEVVDKFETLVNPEIKIPKGIESEIGISQKMIEKAPIFSDITDTLTNLLEESVFIAHNVYFDYSFFKYEFNRVGLEFNLPKTCTVQLSRKFYPQLKSHGLSNIIDHFGFECEKRHRAMDDTQVLIQLYKKMYNEFGKDFSDYFDGTI